MSSPIAEFEVETEEIHCDAPLGDNDVDDEGHTVSHKVGNCGGEIKWTTEEVAKDHFSRFGNCADCGALYTTNG